MGLVWRSKKVLTFFLLTIFSALSSEAKWQGPTEVISGAWGHGFGEFGLREGDSGDDFPEIEAITANGNIVITDSVNKKQLVFSADGSLVKEVKWVVKSSSRGGTTYDIPEFSFGTVAGYRADGSIYSSIGERYFLNSPSGQMIQAYTNRPAELGTLKTERQGLENYKITISYPDRTYALISDSYFEKYIKDTRGSVYGINSGGVWKFNQCGKEIAELILQRQEKETLAAKNALGDSIDFDVEYGEPVVSPNGDVYTWRKGINKYSVVKWTWVDDPNPPANIPDVPQMLSAKNVSMGINVFWKAVPQDPGCATGYDLVRSTTAGGPYSLLAKVSAGTANAAGTIRYTDTTVTAGTTYYYKVRAAAGTDYSAYSNEVSGKK